MRLWTLLVTTVIALGLLAASAVSADARRSYCSPTGDICYGAFGTGTSVQLRITLAAGFFTKYRLCVKSPDRKTDCRRLRLHRVAHGFFDSRVRWKRHFPYRGHGIYRASWRWAGGGRSRAITFREGPSIAVHPHSVHAGRRVRVFGLAGGCPRGSQVALLSRAFSRRHEFAGVAAVFATVRAGDRYSVRTRIPRARRAGRYAITGRCGGGNFGISAQLHVVAP